MLKRALKQCLSLENECNQHVIDVEASALGGSGFDEKKKKRTHKIYSVTF